MNLKLVSLFKRIGWFQVLKKAKEFSKCAMRASKFHASDPPIAEKRRVSARSQMQKLKSPHVIEVNQRKP